MGEKEMKGSSWWVRDELLPNSLLCFGLSGAQLLCSSPGPLETILTTTTTTTTTTSTTITTTNTTPATTTRGLAHKYDRRKLGCKSAPELSHRVSGRATTPLLVGDALCAGDGGEGVVQVR